MNSIHHLATYSDLADKVVIVTGGSRGIGASTARALASNGAQVAVNGRDTAATDAIVAEIQAKGGRAIGVAADCTDFSAVEQMRQKVENELGPVDVLAAFAGGGIVRPGPVEKVSEEEWQSVINGNLTATFLTVKSFLPGMIERRRGAIITMASTAGRLPSAAPAPYSAAKAGIVMLSRNLANDMGKYGIRVNCISPSAVLTERTSRHMPEAQQKEIAAMHPLGRLGVPEDIASAALFLASDSSSWITGVTLDVAGGRVML
ncbi:MAG: short-chain dehydrogenase [Candidatus Sulfotelmatobacter sp.]|nr:short-chain dehydrogenase [Candidatus Sulfotelmatobacter sp.]